MRVQVVIPARLASTRLPEKLLRQVGGKSILQHTYESATLSTLAAGVIAAVDDPRLAALVQSFGGHAEMTSLDCQSGTDRVAEIAQRLTDTEVFVNVQGDEPEIDPAAIDLVASTLLAHPEADLVTVAKPIRDLETLSDPNCVKVVIGDQQQALLFSRSAIPFVRDGGPQDQLAAEPPLFWHHVGLYAYRRSFLLWFQQQPPGLLETTEKLEQLRALAAGKRILVQPVQQAARGIDTLEDLRAFETRYSR